MCPVFFHGQVPGKLLLPLSSSAVTVANLAQVLRDLAVQYEHDTQRTALENVLLSASDTTPTSDGGHGMLGTTRPHPELRGSKHPQHARRPLHCSHILAHDAMQPRRQSE